MLARGFALLFLGGMALLPLASAVEKGPLGIAAIESEKKDAWQEEISETVHSMTLRNQELTYKAVCGTIVIKDEKGQPKGKIFYTAYTKQGEDDLSKRPLTFCFNGGPGASSVWLHIGAFGPKRIVMDPKGHLLTPYRLETNENTLLDQTDLVFVDPVSTGYSRPTTPEEGKLFHGYEEDIKSLAEFIRLYVTRQNRWTSPKYLLGESYGTTRIAGLSLHLHDEFNMPLDGLFMLSAALNFQAFDAKPGNDLPFVHFLPTYTAIAWYYKKLAPELQENLAKAVQESQEFAFNGYLAALHKGDSLAADERRDLAQKLAKYTGLSADYIERANFRIKLQQFSQQLLKSEGQVLGRFDARYTGFAMNPMGDMCFYDPSLEKIINGFAAALNEYLRTDLKWITDENYRVLHSLPDWNYGKANEYLVVTDTLRENFIKNPRLQLFVAAGFYDLALPFSSSEYGLNHIFLNQGMPNPVKLELYEAGHMMYLHKASSEKLRRDIGERIRE